MNNVPQVTPADVPAGAKIIDVREDYEWEGGHVAGAQHITLGTLTERLSELPSKDEEFYVICHGGGRQTVRLNTCARTDTRRKILLAEQVLGSPQSCPWKAKTGRNLPSFTNDAIP